MRRGPLRTQIIRTPLSTAGVANPYDLPQVILAPVLDDIQSNDTNLEPPMVRVRASNSSFLSIDSSADAEGNSSSFVIGGGDQPPLTMRKIKRTALTTYVGVGNSPNINYLNNTLVFRTSIDGFVTDYTATIPEGYYNTVAQAMTALIIALNGAGSGLLFSSAVYSAAAGPASDPQRARINADGGSFTFGPNSTMAVYGRYLFGIPFIPYITGITLPSPAQYAAQSSVSLPIGQILLLSTRWIDVVSRALNEYTKNPSTSDDLGSNSLIARFYITLPTLNTSTTTINGLPNTTINPSLAWTNYERSRQLGTIDITLLDEFGRVLYQAPLGVNDDAPIAIAWSNSTTQLQWVTEI